VALIEYSSNLKMSLGIRSKVYPYNLDKFKLKTTRTEYNNSNINDFSRFSRHYPFKSFDNYYSNNSKKSFKLMDENEKEDLLYDKLEKIALSFDKLEKLFVLSSHLIYGKEDIETILSKVIIDAIVKRDPAKFVQNQLTL
jgi:hypothetical protein